MCATALIWIIATVLSQGLAQGSAQSTSVDSNSSTLTFEEDGIFQVSIWRDKKDYKCTGSIVSAYTVLTTCSCVFVGYWQDLTIYVGGETPKNGIPHRIELVHTDPRYLANKQGEREFDMAVVNLIDPIQLQTDAYGREVYAIPMLLQIYNLTEGRDAEISVFVESSSPSYSSLVGAAVEIKNYDMCNNEILHSYDGPNQICASEPGVELCYDDLGAPMVVQDVTGDRFLAGIASWATVDSWCSMEERNEKRRKRNYKAKERGPIIFSSIPYYIDFILEHGIFTKEFVESTMKKIQAVRERENK